MRDAAPVRNGNPPRPAAFGVEEDGTCHAGGAQRLGKSVHCVLIPERSSPRGPMLRNTAFRQSLRSPQSEVTMGRCANPGGPRLCVVSKPMRPRRGSGHAIWGGYVGNRRAVRQSPEQLTRCRGRCVIAALAPREDTGAVRTAPVVSQRGDCLLVEKGRPACRERISARVAV